MKHFRNRILNRPLTGANTAIAVLAALAFDGGVVHAADKSGYTFFNPTPREQMRELSTDRPDQTESAYTVDAGHWQLEMDFANFTHDDADGVRTTTWNIAPINLKLGLTNNTDLQLMFDSYSRERVRSAAGTTTTRDWGDFTARLKVNLWGNDTPSPQPGDTALAVMPFVKAPLKIGDAGNDRIEGGIIVPLAVTLSGGWGLGVMTELDWVTDADGDSVHVEWINSITASRDLTDRLGGYVEFFSAISAEDDSDWVGQFDVGFTYAVNNNVQLDLGCNFGLTDAAPDVQPFAGFTIRY